jgi:hypothetical protein
MFKTASFEEEIYQAMEKTLVANQVENNYGFNKLAQAAECLHNAAEIFDQAGMHDTATEVMEVLQQLSEAVK